MLLFIAFSKHLALAYLNLPQKFRAGGYNVIVATSIGEEGLDIMEVDLVICFDANVSPLRMIQRMGRTGRKHDGRVDILFSYEQCILCNLLSMNKHGMAYLFSTLTTFLYMFFFITISSLSLSLFNAYCNKSLTCPTSFSLWRIRVERLQSEADKQQECEQTHAKWRDK